MSTLTFTIIQANLVWENIQANLKAFEEKIASIQNKKQVVVLPEMFATGFTMHPQNFPDDMTETVIEWMQGIAQQHKIILCGSAIIKENSLFYNRFLWVQPNQQIIHYDKRHLFSYAGENEHFTAGQKRVIVQVNGWKILLQICYDLRFPVYARQQKTAEYDAILYVANWPEKRIDAWNTLLKARAIENQCYTIGVNRVGTDGNDIYYNGSSSIYNPLGELVYNQVDSEAIFSIELNRDDIIALRKKLPFLEDKDQFHII